MGLQVESIGPRNAPDTQNPLAAGCQNRLTVCHDGSEIQYLARLPTGHAGRQIVVLSEEPCDLRFGLPIVFELRKVSYLRPSDGHTIVVSHHRPNRVGLGLPQARPYPPRPIWPPVNPIEDRREMVQGPFEFPR